MALYTEEAVKICPPEQTVAMAQAVVDKYKMVENDIISYEFRNQDEFGVWAATLEMNPEKFYQLYPEDFPFLKDVDTFWFHKVSGKGLHRTQCSASMFMEFFERLSIEFKIHETKSQRVLKTPSEYIEYLNGIDKNLAEHFKYVLANKASDAQIALVEADDLISGKKLLFPLKLLFQGSNGYAAGNEYHESVAHGIFEVVERFTQTLYMLKALGTTTDDLEKRLPKCMYSFDLKVLDYLDGFEPSIVDVPSLVAEYPDLEEVIANLAAPFDKFEIVDASIELNGVKFYSYLVRQGVDKTGFKLSNMSGCHFNQRIAIIRALTEASQGYVEYEKLNQAWNGYLFSRSFINKAYDAPLPVRKFEKDKRNYTDMEEIYKDCLKAFDQVICINCTNDKFNIPVLSLYIPETYNKSFLWSYLFCTSQVGDLDLIKVLGENNVSLVYKFLTEKSITGIESLFFFENYGLLVETIREKMYYLYLSYLVDKDLNDFILKNLPDSQEKQNIAKLFEEQKTPEISTSVSIDKQDEDSFIYFNNILQKTDKTEQDLAFLVSNYARMGQIEYAVEFANKNNFDAKEIIEQYLAQYDALIGYCSYVNLYARCINVAKKYTFVAKNNQYAELITECEENQKDLERKLAKMISKKDNQNAIFGLVRGDQLAGWSVDSLYQIGEYVYRMTFAITNKKGQKETMVFKISPIRYGEYRTSTSNDFYLEFSTGWFNSAKKKLGFEFIDKIEQLG